MRTPANNPFLPGSDRVPDVWAGRRLDLADFTDVVRPRRVDGVHERGRAVLGEFGIGKSALVNRIADEAAAEGDWIPARVRVAVGADVLGLLAESLQTFIGKRTRDAVAADLTKKLAQRLEQITLPVIGGGVSLRADERDVNAYRKLFAAIVELATLAREDRRLLLLRIDEVQNITDPAAMSQLLTVLGDALEATVERVDADGITRSDALPLVVYLSGLPDFHDLAAEAGATFSRRFRTVELQPLSEPDLREALHPFTNGGWPLLADDGPSSVVMEPGAVDVIVERSLGDPFLFQLAGEAAWNAGTGRVITAEEADRGWGSARREVVTYVEGRLAGLTDLQHQVLSAAAGLPEDERSSAAIAAAMGRSSSASIASTLRSLDVEHRLIRRRGGVVDVRSPAVAAYLGGDWP